MEYKFKVGDIIINKKGRGVSKEITGLKEGLYVTKTAWRVLERSFEFDQSYLETNYRKFTPLEKAMK